MAIPFTAIGGAQRVLNSVFRVLPKMSTSGCAKPREDAEASTWEVKKDTCGVLKSMNLKESGLVRGV